MENVKRIILLFVLTVFCLISFQKNVYACPGSTGDPVNWVQPTIDIWTRGFENYGIFYFNGYDGDNVSNNSCSQNFTVYFGDGGSINLQGWSQYCYHEYPDPGYGQTLYYCGSVAFQDSYCSMAHVSFCVPITSPPSTYTISTSVNNANYGYISASGGSFSTGTIVSGDVTVNRDEDITLTAIPNSCYGVDDWGVLVNGEQVFYNQTSYSFYHVRQNQTFSASFSPLQYSISTSSNPTAGGTTSGGGTYNCGTSVTITATPAAGYSFTGWSGDASGSTNSLTVTMNGNKNITANFAPIQYTLTVSAANGTVSKSPNQANYTAGSNVSITATPASGYTFTSWSGDAAGTANPLTVPMNGNKNITANFAPILGSGLSSNYYTSTVYFNTKWNESTSKFEMYDEQRKIKTYTASGGTAWPSTSLTDDNNDWQNKAAVDAHWGVEQVYDFYKEVLERNGYDNRGSEIKSLVECSMPNGSPDTGSGQSGGTLNFGNGDGKNWSSITSLDVIGHEFTHAVIANIKVDYSADERGPIIEAMCDILGKAAEFYATRQHADWSKPDWSFGGKCNKTGGAIRYMDKPNKTNPPQPETYKGLYWDTGGDDYAAHINNGVLNYAFYLMTVGKSGTNEAGDYNVTGIGIEKTQKIAYKALCNLPPGAMFKDVKSAFLSAASALGLTSAEIKTVADAFAAVGIGINLTVQNSFIKGTIYVKDKERDSPYTYVASEGSPQKYQAISQYYEPYNRVWNTSDDPSYWKKQYPNQMPRNVTTDPIYSFTALTTDHRATYIADLKTVYTGRITINDTWNEDVKVDGNITVPSGVTLTIASGVKVNLNTFSITCSGSGKIINQTGTFPFTGQYAVVSNSAKTEFRGAYQSIQTAVNNRLGDCLDVYVGPGTYSENVSLKPNMKLIGVSKDATHINGTININGTIDPYDYETTWVRDLKANYIAVYNSDAVHYIQGCKITQTVEVSGIYSPDLVRIDNTNFLPNYGYPGIFTDQGIIFGLSCPEKS